MRHAFRLSVILFLMLGSGQVAASSWFGAGRCGIVVAARQSLGEVRIYINENGWSDDARVFASDNGWYAIVVAQVPDNVADSVLDRQKRQGRIPPDAYCSEGDAYRREVPLMADGRSVAPADPTALWADFDSRPLSRTERRMLQAALAMQGDYVGLLDGVWGSGSQAALERYTARQHGAEPVNAHAAQLVRDTLWQWDADGWEPMDIGWLGISMLLPQEGLYLHEEDDGVQTWRHRDDMLTIMFADFPGAGMASLHADLMGERGQIAEPYTVRNSDMWITSLRFAGHASYLRSDLIAGTWSTTAIFAQDRHANAMALVTSSIKRGGADPIFPPRGGVLDRNADALAAISRSESADDHPSEDVHEDDRPNRVAVARPERQPPPDDQRPQPTEARSTGTGFFVSEDGVALTNAHVIDGCRFVHLGGQAAEVIAQSSAFDLAAVRVSEASEMTPLPFATGNAGLNADLTVAGYPLHGLLGGLNITRGAVSSLRGLGGDETTLQISAPVQPGNSGGPAVDRFGHVVGVVVAKLDTVALAEASGDIAQNINFVIRGSVATAFLSAHDIGYARAPADAEPLSPEDAARRLQDATRLIECF
ncbi:S1C family serine protease [Palleronia sp. THAF1]|uniref:S1C family serine protease n=1 Tax=Palleronia sp. THAF1 TaxID=2587842 RepID=UPI000F52FA95|nr:serine protease [Palleronia sp. THAF1]